MSSIYPTNFYVKFDFYSTAATTSSYLFYLGENFLTSSGGTNTPIKFLVYITTDPDDNILKNNRSNIFKNDSAKLTISGPAFLVDTMYSVTFSVIEDITNNIIGMLTINGETYTGTLALNSDFDKSLSLTDYSTSRIFLNGVSFETTRNDEDMRYYNFEIGTYLTPISPSADLIYIGEDYQANSSIWTGSNLTVTSTFDLQLHFRLKDNNNSFTHSLKIPVDKLCEIHFKLQSNDSGLYATLDIDGTIETYTFNVDQIDLTYPLSNYENPRILLNGLDFDTTYDRNINNLQVYTL